ncbi:MAG: MFS transporter [Actinobacteria bacterium]|nr:MFS transporter [Actinomycetota bacterium]
MATASRRPSLAPVVLLETANILSGIGNGIVVIAIPLLVLRETGSAALYGLIGVIAVLPSLIALPLVGAMIDRYGPRWNSVASDVASATSVLMIPVLLAVDALSVPAIVVLAVLGAVIDPVGFTARKAAIEPAARASGVPVDKVNGIHDALFGLGWAAGPPLGALLVAGLGTGATFLTAGVLAVGAAISMAFVRAAGVRAVGAASAGRLTELVAGLRALWRDHPLRALTIVNAILAALYFPAEVVVLPVHFEQIGDTVGLGIVLSAMAGGYVAGAFAYGWLVARIGRVRIFQVALVGTAVAAVPLAFLPPLPLMAVAGAVLGASWGPVSPLVASLVQTRMPLAVQGRVFAVEMTLFTALPPVMILATGLGVDAWGVDVVYLVLGAAFALTALLALAVPVLRHLDAPVAQEALDGAD